MGNRLSGDDATSPDAAPKITASGTVNAAHGYTFTTSGISGTGSSSKKHRSASGDTIGQHARNKG